MDFAYSWAHMCSIAYLCAWTDKMTYKNVALPARLTLRGACEIFIREAARYLMIYVSSKLLVQHLQTEE